MYHHVKKLMYTVNIGTPDVQFGRMLLEQFGGANGELAAAMQYTVQAWNCVDDLGRRDLLLDIGTEELSHLEVVGALIRMHLAPLKTAREAAEAMTTMARAVADMTRMAHSLQTSSAVYGSRGLRTSSARMTVTRFLAGSMR